MIDNNNKTMIDLAREHLEETKNDTFLKVFSYVSSNLKETWKEQNSSLTLPEIESMKKSELFIKMSILIEFVKLTSNKWTLSKFLSQSEKENINLYENSIVIKSEEI